MTSKETVHARQCHVQHHDAVVIGAGFAGIYALYRLSRQKLDVIALESGGDVGGVWYHNRYPGARVDVESLQYCYFFSAELFREWKWTERYAAQPELQKYIAHVTDRFGLRKLISFNNRVTSADWNESSGQWEVATSTGLLVTCRYLITAMGNLTKPVKPDFDGLDQFDGDWVQTSRWPDDPVEFAGKRVGIIGTGATGVQCVTSLAGVASHLTVFQRSPNFCMPSRNRLLQAAEIDAICGQFDTYRENLFNTPGLSVFPAPKCFFSLSHEQRLETLEERWRDGGHSINFAFEGTQTNRTVNDFIAEFHRGKIKEIVLDPKTAEDLMPRDHEFGLRRLPVTDGYYETFNRDDVELVNVRKDPIRRFVKEGIELESGARHHLDIVLFAIGFESFTGALLEASIRNGQGTPLASTWWPGWQTYLGVMSSGYPNLFMVCGPGGVTISANVVPSSEYHVDWIGDLIAHMEKEGHKRVEPDPDAQARWRQEVAEISAPLFVMQDNRPNRIVQFNAETGERVCMTYLGGFQRYRERFDAERVSDFPNFRFGKLASMSEAGDATPA